MTPKEYRDYKERKFRKVKKSKVILDKPVQKKS